MIDKTNLLDPTAANDLTNCEKEAVEGAQNTGKNLRSTDATTSKEHLNADRYTGGIIEQTIDSKAVAGFGQPGGDSDISGGVANLDETAGKIVNQNEYND